MKLQRTKVILLVIFSVVAMSIVACKNQKSSALNKTEYKRQIDEWHKKRIARLTAEDSWLSLAGLFWLKSGENSFGFGQGNDIQFSDKEKPITIGWFYLNDSTVKVRVKEGVQVLVDGKPIREMVLKSDVSGKPTVMSMGSLMWYVIERDGRYGIRLKDKNNPAIKDFKGIKRFPVDLKWRIKAKFEPYQPPKNIPIPTVLGTTTSSTCPGALVFELNGKTFRLDVLADSPKDPLFVIFGDKTNGEETYVTGRFLVVDPPDENGETFIDFNKAYNPPCAFTEYATCPLPPPQNRLPVAVKAGEKAYEGGTHH